MSRNVDFAEGQTITVFCDGACKGNPGPGGWGSIVAFGNEEVTELGGADPQTTNNMMELTAAIRALDAVEAGMLERGWSAVPLQIFSDSKYVITGATQWRHGWKKNQWKKADGMLVSNLRHWQELDALCDRLLLRTRMQWAYVEAHVGIPGNERCDQIASSFAEGREPVLWSGARSEYNVDLTQTVSTTPKAPVVKDTSGRFPLYISWIGGELCEHKTWPECQARVHGRSGAKYKKVSSQTEYDDVLKAWKS